MPFIFNWKKALLWGFVTMIVFTPILAFGGNKLDVACAPIGYGVGCHLYHGWTAIMNGYADLWLRLFAPRCVGGNGPDDCIGPALGIMFWTLFAAGFLTGGLVWRKKKKMPPLDSARV